jgi:hypothetical protein
MRSISDKHIKKVAWSLEGAVGVKANATPRARTSPNGKATASRLHALTLIASNIGDSPSRMGSAPSWMHWIHWH